MKKVIILLFAVLLINLGANAQMDRKGLFGDSAGEFSIMLSGIGPAYLFGDIGGKVEEQVLGFTDWDIAKTRYLFSIGLRHIFPNSMALKANFVYGQFAGTDEGTSNEARGWSYKSSLSEVGLHFEYIFFGGPFAETKTPHALYGFVGGAVAFNNVSEVVNSIPLAQFPAIRALDDPQDGSSTIAMIPFGAGYQYAINRSINIGAEFEMQYAFTDHLEGLTTYYSDFDDVLASLNLTFTYKIFGGIRNADRCNCDW